MNWLKRLLSKLASVRHASKYDYVSTDCLNWITRRF